MADRSAIEWTDSSFNPWVGCTKISPACDHCYAEAMMDTRLGRARWGAGQPRVRTSAANWRKPLRWDRTAFHECITCGWRGEDRALVEPGRVCPACSGNAFRAARRRVFCASLADVFDNEVPPQWRSDLFELIGGTENVDWLLLTKRIGNVARMLDDVRTELQLRGLEPQQWPWPNVWLGATICNQAEADRDIPKLLQVPARVRFLSIEPMLGPIHLAGGALPWDRTNTRARCGHYWMTERPCPSCSVADQTRSDRANVSHPINCGWAKDNGQQPGGIDWIIAGGESGAHARPSHPDWLRSLRDQCAAAGVPFLFKQWGEFAPTTRTMAEVAASSRPLMGVEHSASCPYPIALVDRVGKKAAGRMLDGREHNGFPA
jgi:protein gp37